MKRRLALLAAVSVLAARAAGPAFAANAPLTGLAPHGPPAPSDLIPVQPAAGPSLMSSTAGDVQNFVLTSVKAYGAKGDGVTDDTAAIQAAINSGLSLYFPPGVYVISASLLVETPANDGQVLRGAGSWGQPDAFNSATGGGAAVIRPTSAVTKVFVIDGTPFPGGGYQQSWVQGFGIENLVIDMARMSDVSTSVAINQIQGWDGHYSSVRVINDGTNKRAWLMSAGAFTTTLLNDQGHILDFEGNSPSFGVTTMTVINCDCGKVIATYTGDLLIFGGALQNSDGSSIVKLRNSFDIDIKTDVEGNGVYLDFDSTDNFVSSYSELQGFSGTYTIGTPGQDFQLWDQQTNYYASPPCQWNSSSTGFELNGCGTGSNFSRLESGSLVNDQYITQGRTSSETMWGVAGEANWFVSGSAQGDTVLGSISNSSVWLMANQTAGAKITSTGFNTYGTGVLHESTLNATTSVTSPLGNFTYAVLGGAQVQPPADGQMFTLQNAAGSVFMVCTSSATIGSALCAVDNGADWAGYSDVGSTRTYDLDSGTGNASFSGTVTAGGLTGPLNGSVGAITPSTVKGTLVTATQGVITPPVAYGSLPASPTVGERAAVSNTSGCTFGSPVNGSGSTFCPVIYTGSAWVAG